MVQRPPRRAYPVCLGKWTRKMSWFSASRARRSCGLGIRTLNIKLTRCYKLWHCWKKKDRQSKTVILQSLESQKKAARPAIDANLLHAANLTLPNASGPSAAPDALGSSSSNSFSSLNTSTTMINWKTKRAYRDDATRLEAD